MLRDELPAHSGQQTALGQKSHKGPVVLDHGDNAGHIVVDGGDDLFESGIPLHRDVVIGEVGLGGARAVFLRHQFLQPEDPQQTVPTVYHQQATHDLIWENIELFAARYLTTNLRIDVRPFVLSGIDVGADVRDMIVGGDESKTSLSLFGDIATDLPVSFSAEPSFEAEVEGSDRTLFSFPSFTVFPTAEAPVEIEETSVSADALTVIFDQETRIELNMQLENYYPGRSLDLGQGITINLKVRKKGGLIFNV